MTTKAAGFAPEIVALFRRSKILGLRVGRSEHRFVGLWVVVDDDRVFVRSWSVSPQGWYERLRRRAVATSRSATGRCAFAPS